ncbi:hypothetical protein AVEN_14942-1, partial [Araneus ventricosus]
GETTPGLAPPALSRLVRPTSAGALACSRPMRAADLRWNQVSNLDPPALRLKCYR